MFYKSSLIKTFRVMGMAVRAGSNLATLTRPHRLLYLRTYPTLMVNPDGSTITIHYKEPRKIIKMPLDLSSLSEEELKREQKRRRAKEKVVIKEKTIVDSYNPDKYAKFWKKT